MKNKIKKFRIPLPKQTEKTFKDKTKYDRKRNKRILPNK
jgi:hypothetical protein